MSNNVISYPNSAGYKDLMQNHSVVLFDAELKKVFKIKVEYERKTHCSHHPAAIDRAGLFRTERIAKGLLYR